MPQHITVVDSYFGYSFDIERYGEGKAAFVKDMEKKALAYYMCKINQGDTK